MDVMPVGPYRTISVGDQHVPWYIIPFDREGRCEGPQTRERLIQDVREGKYSDIYLFSHGWNNDWQAAIQRYESFVQGFLEMRKEFQLPIRPDYRPLLVGVYWPSTALVTDAERGPRILADGENNRLDDEAVADERQRIAELAGAVAPEKVERFYELAQQTEMSEADAREFAELVQSVYATADDELPGATVRLPIDIISAAGSAQQEVPDKRTSGTADSTEMPAPKTAGIFSGLKKILPRNIIRIATVYQMKDRAGKIGSLGGRRLVEDLLNQTGARLHLIGHSYGAKLLLSALSTATIRDSQRQAYSILLLEPAVSYLCFAEKIPGTGQEGGYRNVLQRVTKPIFSTYSTHDLALRRAYQIALRRATDKGELPGIAAEEKVPAYAALGGYGPRESGEKLKPILRPPHDYDLSEGARLYGIDGSEGISGHGDVSNKYTWWALYFLAAKA